MDNRETDDFAKILATNTSRRRAFSAVAGGGAASAARSGRRSATVRGALDPVTEAGRRLAAVVDDDQVPLPTVVLPAGFVGTGERP